MLLQYVRTTDAKRPEKKNQALKTYVYCMANYDISWPPLFHKIVYC